MRRINKDDKKFAHRINKLEADLINLVQRFSSKIKVGKITLAGLAITIMMLVIAGGIWVASKDDSRGKQKVEDFPGLGSALTNLTVAVDAGHGGVDPGAVGTANTLEKNVTRDISKRLQVLLTQAGCNVVMIRDTDCDFGTASNLLQRKREDLAYRTQKALEANSDIYLSIHANSFPDKNQHGAQVFYHAESVEGKAIAEMVQESLNNVAARKRVAKANQSYFILKKTDQVALTIEVGFISNIQEEKKISQPEYQEKLAMAILEGIAKYYNNK
jgi:N-acetylmuramoyl-L-alanine amidase